MNVELLVEKTSREQASTAPPLPDLASGELAALYQAHSREIYYLTLRLLGDAQRAEDATHDVFLKAFRKWHDFRGDSSCRAWLYRIAINHCSNLRQSWHNRHIFTAEEDLVEHNAAPVTDSPLRVLEVKELGNRIQKTLDRLSEEYRLLLLLVADEELSYEEIAALTDQSADAVRGKLHRARKAFALIFRGDD
ncbi:MAG TPA: sigma-70 family RNA polymerase sigma factor [Verrucomicrobiae bacterium]|nr:sigma-70 family RNA polymerase sigma factor [Verrucomicrobiae bacterium]